MDTKFYHHFFLLFGVILLARLYEINLSHRNEKILLRNHNAKLLSRYEHYFVYFFHVSWFIFFMTESLTQQNTLFGLPAMGCYLLLTIAQVLRMESMRALGVHWTAKIYAVKNQPISREGIFHFIAHPSYLAVILEFFALPYLFHAYWTLVIFFPLNLILIFNRVHLEKKITGRLFL
ncbi:MAG: isoprenylcysteine carboxylmethyltransferase family protein [Bacteriovoracaceae bacterium]|nr:isoprenylcysteine carboxylmethyltransferase family protein [Bacteriovoracaceae bacterium]